MTLQIILPGYYLNYAVGLVPFGLGDVFRTPCDFILQYSISESVVLFLGLQKTPYFQSSFTGMRVAHILGKALRQKLLHI